MKKLIILMFVAVFLIANASAYFVVQNHTNDAFTVTDNVDNHPGGMRFTVIHGNMTLKNVTVSTRVTAPTLELRDNADTTTLNSSAIGGNKVANISYNLVNGTSYFLKVTTGGNHAYGTGNSYPFTSNNVTWNDGMNPTTGGFDTNNGGYDIVNFTAEFDAVTPETQIITTELITPADSSETTLVNVTFNATQSVTNLNLTNATLHLWFSNGTLINQTTNTVTGNSTNSTTWLLNNLGFSNYIWNVNSCGINSSSVTNCSFANNNFTFEIKQFTVNTETFLNNSLETSNETFALNISTISNILSISPILIFNGTSYVGTSTQTAPGEFIIERVLDIPLVDGGNDSSIKNFYWELEIFDDAGGSINSNTTVRTQNVSRSYFAACAGDINAQAVNYTIYNEGDPSARLASTFKGSLEWYHGGGTVVRNQSFDLSAAESHVFCIDPNRTYYTDVNLIDLTSGGYEPRGYTFLDEVYSNVTTLQPLYLLSTGSSKDVIIEVKDVGLSSLANYLVEIERFYPDDNEYRLVESQLTDAFGQIVSTLVENDVKYVFKFYDTENNLVKTTTDVTITCRATICVAQFVIEDTADDFDRFSPPSDYIYSLNWTNTSQLFTFTWTDNTGAAGLSHNLEVTRFAVNGSSLLCDITSSSTSGSMTCDLSGYDSGSFTAQVYRTTTEGGTQRIATLAAKIGAAIGGLEGLMWGMVLLLTTIMIGLFSPFIAIILFVVVFILLGILGVVYANAAIYFAVIVIGALFAWAFKG